MTDARIKYTTKLGTTHDTITHVGSDSWKWTAQNVIKSIEDGGNSFHTNVNGVRAEVRVVDDPQKGKYLRTHADKKWSNNLLALPGFPENWTAKS